MLSLPVRRTGLGYSFRTSRDCLSVGLLVVDICPMMGAGSSQPIRGTHPVWFKWKIESGPRQVEAHTHRRLGIETLRQSVLLVQQSIDL